MSESLMSAEEGHVLRLMDRATLRRGFGAFPSQLRSARRASHISTDAVAGLLGVSGALVRMWESGAREPSMTAVMAMAALYQDPWLQGYCVGLTALTTTEGKG